MASDRAKAGKYNWHQVPDFDQQWPNPTTATDPAGGSFGEGAQYCLPAAVLNWLVWIKWTNRSAAISSLLPELTPPGGANPDTAPSLTPDQIRCQLIKLGSQMKTDMTVGTTLTDGVELLYPYLNPTPSGYDVIGLDFLPMATVEPGDIYDNWWSSGPPRVLPILEIGWYQYGSADAAGALSGYFNNGSHFVTLASLSKPDDQGACTAQLANSLDPDKTAASTTTSLDLQSPFAITACQVQPLTASFQLDYDGQSTLPLLVEFPLPTQFNGMPIYSVVKGMLLLQSTFVISVVGAHVNVIWPDGATEIGPFSWLTNTQPPPPPTPIPDVRVREDELGAVYAINPLWRNQLVIAVSGTPGLWTLNLATKDAQKLDQVTEQLDHLAFAGPGALLYATSGNQLLAIDTRQAGTRYRYALPFAPGALTADLIHHRLYAVSPAGDQLLDFDLSGDPEPKNPVQTNAPKPATPGPSAPAPNPQGNGDLSATVDPMTGELLIHQTGSDTVGVHDPKAMFVRPATRPLPSTDLQSLQATGGGVLYFSQKSPTTDNEKTGTGYRLAAVDRSGAPVPNPLFPNAKVGATLVVSGPFNGTTTQAQPTPPQSQKTIS